MGNSPQDCTISDVVVLKPWSTNDVLVQKPFKSKLGYDDTSVDLLKLWYHGSKFADTGLLRYWQTQSYPIRQIVSPLNPNNHNWIQFSFSPKEPGVMLIQDPVDVSMKSETMRYIGHYLSCVQIIQFYKEPKIRQ
eukprot:4822293-Ditylum_brightwellii.AAC.1